MRIVAVILALAFATPGYAQALGGLRAASLGDEQRMTRDQQIT